MNVDTGNNNAGESEWLPYDRSLNLRSEISDYLTQNPIASCIDTEDAASADVRLERYVTTDGLKYLEFDSKYRKHRMDGELEEDWSAD